MNNFLLVDDQSSQSIHKLQHLYKNNYWIKKNNNVLSLIYTQAAACWCVAVEGVKVLKMSCLVSKHKLRILNLVRLLQLERQALHFFSRTQVFGRWMVISWWEDRRERMLVLLGARVRLFCCSKKDLCSHHHDVERRFYSIFFLISYTLCECRKQIWFITANGKF